jgi:cytochrome c556
MKKLVTPVMFVWLTTFVFATTATEEQQYQERMKRTGGYMRMLRENFKTNNREKVISAAKELESIFKQEGKFWTKRGTSDAVKLSKEAQDAARAIVTAAKKKEDDQAAVALKNLTNSCTACHASHRELTSGCSGRIK